MSELILGQYLHRESIIHKINPLVKLVFLILLSVLILVFDEFIYLFLAFVFFIALLSKISLLRYVKQLKPLLVLFLFIFLMHAFFTSVVLGFQVVLKFILLIEAASVLTYTTRITALVSGLEKLLFPLKVFGVNPSKIAVMVSITIRFIPHLLDEANKIRDAQKARGVRPGVDSVTALTIPLLIKTFRTGSNLADAMEARCYDGN